MISPGLPTRPDCQVLLRLQLFVWSQASQQRSCSLSISSAVVQEVGREGQPDRHHPITHKVCFQVEAHCSRVISTPSLERGLGSALVVVCSGKSRILLSKFSWWRRLKDRISIRKETLRIRETHKAADV